MKYKNVIIDDAAGSIITSKLDEKQMKYFLLTDVSKAKEYLRTSLGLSEYERLREMFFHVCIEKFDYKVLVTRRAYLLFELFLKIFQEYEEEVLSFKTPFELNGKFYNSHSMCLLEKKLKEENKKSILIVDDIIVNGRAVTDTYNLFSEYPENVAYIWTFLKSVYANCLKEEVEEHLTTYKPCSEKSWKDTSRKFTDAIRILQKGYTSYIDSYFSDFLIENAFTVLENNYDNENTDMVIISKPFDEKTSYAYIMKKSDESNANKGKRNETFCLRFYEQNNGTLVIPYLFVDAVEANSLYNYAIRLLTENGINKIPEYFHDNRNDNDENISTYFFKWAINEICKKKTFELLFGKKGVAKDFITIEHSMTFDSSVLGEFVEIPKNWKSSSAIETKNSLYDDDIELCRGVIEDEFKSMHNFIENKDLKIEYKNGSVTDDENTKKLAKVIRQCFTQYCHVIKEVDEKRTEKSDKEQKRCIGISVDDVCACTYKVLNERYDIGFPKSVLYSIVLSVVIRSWDCGETSYNFYSFSPVQKETDSNVVLGLIRNGEQVFMGIYNEFSEIYPYFYELTRRTLSFKTSYLMSFGRFLSTKLDKEKEKRLQMFMRCIEINSSYFDDVLVVEPKKRIERAEEIVNEFLLQTH